MFKSFINWLFGYMLLEISGEMKDRFINICSKKNILFWNMEKKN